MRALVATLCVLTFFLAMSFAAGVMDARKRGSDSMPPQFANAFFGGLCLVSFVLACLLALMRLAPR